MLQVVSIRNCIVKKAESMQSGSTHILDLYSSYEYIYLLR